VYPDENKAKILICNVAIRMATACIVCNKNIWQQTYYQLQQNRQMEHELGLWLAWTSQKRYRHWDYKRIEFECQAGSMYLGSIDSWFLLSETCRICWRDTKSALV